MRREGHELVLRRHEADAEVLRRVLLKRLGAAEDPGKSKPALSSLGNSPSVSVSLQDSLYALMSTNGGPTHSTVLNDVVSGSAGEGYAAGPGYDVATGLGSVNVQQLIDYLDTK